MKPLADLSSRISFIVILHRVVSTGGNSSTYVCILYLYTCIYIYIYYVYIYVCVCVCICFKYIYIDIDIDIDTSVLQMLRLFQD